MSHRGRIHEASQEGRLLRFFKAGGTCTPMEALRRFQTFRLAGRVFNLREAGHKIRTEIVHLRNGKRVARYVMRRRNNRR